MIDIYYYPTPNTWKVTIMLEECGLPYRVIPTNIAKGEQFSEEFLSINPNHRVPAIVDHDVAGGPLSIFESGAILVYLAEKTGRFLPTEVHARMDVLQWLFWQMAGQGPMFGQVMHFRKIALEEVPYAIKRYVDEAGRLFAVMDLRLGEREFIAGDYSIADMACYGWCTFHDWMQQDLDAVPNVKRWFEAMGERPGVQRGMAVGDETRDDYEALQPEARKFLFGQSAKTLKGGN